MKGEKNSPARAKQVCRAVLNKPRGEAKIGIAIIMYHDPWRINFGFGQDLGIYTWILKFIGANTIFL